VPDAGPAIRDATAGDAAAIAHDPTMPLYLWVLGQNAAGQAFYEARGGSCVERRSRQPNPGVALRYVWPDPSALLERR
jgi:hypothetical protein